MQQFTPPISDVPTFYSNVPCTLPAAFRGTWGLVDSKSLHWLVHSDVVWWRGVGGEVIFAAAEQRRRRPCRTARCQSADGSRHQGLADVLLLLPCTDAQDDARPVAATLCQTPNHAAHTLMKRDHETFIHPFNTAAQLHNNTVKFQRKKHTNLTQNKKLSCR